MIVYEILKATTLCCCLMMMNEIDNLTLIVEAVLVESLFIIYIKVINVYKLSYIYIIM